MKHNISHHLRQESTWIIILLLLIGGLFYSRSACHVVIGDELRYFYTFDLQPGENYFNFNKMRSIHGFGDIVDSQVNHYQTVNGRTFVHTIEQIFSSIIGVRWYYVLNTFIFLVTLLLFIRVAFPRSSENSPWAWLAVVAAFLYMFPSPGRLWLSINLSLNYLWPAAATLGAMILWQKASMEAWRPTKRWQSLLTILLCFFLGWSNEAFSLPLSGGLFIYQMQNYKKAKWTGISACILYPLWAGAIMLLLSPGNWLRADGGMDTLGSFWTVISEMRLLWIAVIAGCTAAIARPRMLAAFIRENRITATALALAICMGILAHTAARAFTAIELFSAILIARAAAPALRPMTRRGWTIWGTIAVLLVTHQTLITVEHYRQYDSIRQTVIDFEKSPSGTVRYRFHEPPWWAAPFVYWQIPTTEGADYEWRLLGIVRSNGRKPFTALEESIYDHIEDIPGSIGTGDLAPFIKTGRNSYLADASSLESNRFEITTSDSMKTTVYRRLFLTPGGRKIAFIIPPAGKAITSIRAIGTH